MVVRERVRTGGRSARIQAAVHQAVRDLLAETDRADLSMPMIAARAGVTPSTLYRRWGDLGDLLADVAVARLRPVGEPLDTGSTDGDLAAWLEQYMEEMSSDVGRAMLRDILGPADPGTTEQCCAYTTEALAIIADRARGRGEPGFEVDAVIDQVVAPIVYRILFGGRALTPSYCRALLDRLAL